MRAKFIRGEDPKKSMGLGLRLKIEKWLEDYFQYISNATRKSKYIINDDLTIDINGFFATHWKGNFPEWINFNKIDGTFQLYKTEMKSLRGCPKIVLGDFSCQENKIKNLIGGPEEVRGNYNCSVNSNLESLEGLAKIIGKNLVCNNKYGLDESDIPKGTIIEGSIQIDNWGTW